ncbi:MAG: NERD domain-containing protein [Oscillospiraceae bacterium]|nr:NERD domain-containing protein [Oscillospiraceae bacterium]MBP5239226.1 NERD domain-containing protein [Oscillospiraceae bacterium]MBP5743378.1 NERD domain-containing protein [Oscillospiraceae bacterium]
MGIGIIIIVIVILYFVVVRNKNYSTRKGKAGENRVSSILDRLPQNYYVINNVIVPTKTATSQIDHIVVSPYGVFVIETKNYSGWIFGSENSQKWKETFPTESHQFYNPIKQNWGHIYALSEYLNLDKRAFKPVIVFSNEASLKVDTTTTPVIHMSQLKKTIISYTQEILSYEEVKRVFNQISRVNLAGTEIEDKHTQSVKNKVAQQKLALKQGKCPQCGGDLILRRGKYGKFYGCSNYPQCKFTHNIR